MTQSLRDKTFEPRKKTFIDLSSIQPQFGSLFCQLLPDLPLISRLCFFLRRSKKKKEKKKEIRNNRAELLEISKKRKGKIDSISVTLENVQFTGAVRAASSASRTSTVVTAGRDTGHHEARFPENVNFGDVSKFTRLVNLSGLHERAGIRGTSVRTPTPWTSILRVARRKPKKGYQATTRPSQETGPALPGWPSLRSGKKTGEEPRRFSKQIRGYFTSVSVQVGCVSNGDDRPVRRITRCSGRTATNKSDTPDGYIPVATSETSVYVCARVSSLSPIVVHYSRVTLRIVNENRAPHVFPVHARSSSSYGRRSIRDLLGRERHPAKK